MGMLTSVTNPSSDGMFSKVYEIEDFHPEAPAFCQVTSTFRGWVASISWESGVDGETLAWNPEAPQEMRKLVAEALDIQDET